MEITSAIITSHYRLHRLCPRISSGLALEDPVRAYLDEIARDALPTELIGFTGGEPFLNRDLLPMLDDVLARGLRALVPSR